MPKTKKHFFLSTNGARVYVVPRCATSVVHLEPGCLSEQCEGCGDDVCLNLRWIGVRSVECNTCHAVYVVTEEGA